MASSLLPILANENRASFQFRIVQFFHCFLGSFGRGKFDNATSLGAAIVHRHYFRMDDITGGAHVVLQVLPCNFIGKITHVDRLAPLKTSNSLPSPTSTATWGSSAFFLAIFPDKNLSSHQIGIVQSFHCPVRIFDCGILDDTASLAATIVASQDVSTNYFSCRTHVVLEIAPCYGPGKISHVDTFVLRHSIFSSFHGVRAFGLLIPGPATAPGRRASSRGGDVDAILGASGGRGG
mmetsp:Transcript_30133/g.72823  ORF Transcript_30133/g.72823 Transcript_30133/m.72823 type:complete len:236 (-) Transcript_30133:112-819(-)